MITPPASIYEFGPFRLDTLKRLLFRDGDVVPLTPKTFEVLVSLVESSDRVLEKSELMTTVWPDSFVEESNLTQSVFMLRKALGESSSEHRYIVTVPGRGYRFVASVNRLTDGEADVVIERHTRSRITAEREQETDLRTGIDASHASRRRLPAAVDPQQASGRKSRVTLLVASALLVGVIVAAIYFWTGRKTVPAKTIRQVKSVAVLPFRNLGDDPGSDYFSDGMTESLITALSRIEGMKVISRGSVFGYKGKEVDPREVGRELGVASVAEGSVRIDGETVRVTVRLASAEDRSILWASETFIRPLRDIFALQDEIARSVAGGLKIELTGEERQQLTRVDTNNVEAYRFYLMGRALWNKRTEEQINQGIDYFQKALKLDPKFARGYAGLADSYALLNFYGSPKQAEVFPKAIAAAERALALDDSLAETHTTLAYIKHTYEWDWNGAEIEFKRAIELDPNYLTARHWYSEYLTGKERFAEAIAEIEKARELDPRSVLINTQLGAPYFYSRRYDEAIDLYLKALAMDPNFALATYALALSYEQQGKFEEAITTFQRALKLFGSNTGAGALGHAYAVSGRKAEARAMLREMLAQSKQHHVSPYRIALIYAGLNENDNAFAWLQKAIDERDERLVRVKVDPQLYSLHADPEFEKVLRKIGLAQ